jgi:zinc protease
MSAGRRFSRGRSILKRRFLFAAAVALAPHLPAAAQTAAAPSSPAAADSLLPGDTTVVVGKLANGLTYYVRRNAEPPERAELRLVVNAGSILEDDDQRGLAHFVEHMAFNGTRRFAKHEIVDYLESIGMRFGPDVNAYTSFDETVYMLSLPTDTAGVLETGLDILEDWAGGITFDTAEVRKERGVVIEEWRLGRGAGMRVTEKQFPVLFAGSRYAERLPIGTVETLRGFDVEALTRFYRDWYRPDLMAVVAVGDFDPKAVEAMIRERFGRLPARQHPRPRTIFPVPDHAQTRYSRVTDPEIPSTSVNVVRTVPSRPRATRAAYREAIVESLYAGMLDDRLNEITQKPGAPLVGVSTYRGALVRPVDAFYLSAQVPEGGAARGLAALLAEGERAVRHGFTAPELEREKADLLRAYEQMYAEREKETSSGFAAQYTGHYLYGGPLLNTAIEYELHRDLLPGIAVAEVDAVARTALPRQGRTVLISGPEGAATPTEAELAAVVESVSRAPLEAYAETVSDAPLLARMPTPGRVVETRRTEEIGVTEWRLSNGVRVVMKPTDFKKDEIILSGRSPGGESLLPDSAYLSGVTAAAAAQIGGVGDLNVVDLQKRLAGKSAVAGAYVDDLSEGISGYASPRDVELMLQLVHLYFTAPRRDTTAWAAYLDRARTMLANRGASPEAAFGDTLNAVLTQGHPRARPLTSASFDSLSLDRSLAIYRDRFADAGDFTFFIVGAFEPDSLKPLIETYLGGLPSTGRKETWRDLGIRAPTGVVRRTVRRGVEPKARTQIIFSGPVEFDRRSVSLLRSLADALEIRLRERLREELGGTYGVSVGGSAERDPRPEYRFAIDFGADPERVDELARVVFAQIDSVKAEGVPEKDLVKVREAQRREREVSLRENNYWLSALMTYDRLGWDPRQIPAQPLSAALTPAELRDAARRFLNTGNYVQVTLLPEAAAPANASPAAAIGARGTGTAP